MVKANMIKIKEFLFMLLEDCNQNHISTDKKYDIRNKSLSVFQLRKNC